MLYSNANMLEVIVERQSYKSPTHRPEMSSVWILTALPSTKTYFLKTCNSQNILSIFETFSETDTSNRHGRQFFDIYVFYLYLIF